MCVSSLLFSFSNTITSGKLVLLGSFMHSFIFSNAVSVSSSILISFLYVIDYIHMDWWESMLLNSLLLFSTSQLHSLHV